MASWSGEAHYRAVLAVSNAANEHLDLSRLLEAVAMALEDLVPIDNIGVFGREGGPSKEVHGHSRSNPRRRGEAEKTYLDRVLNVDQQLVTREMLQALEVLERDRTPLISPWTPYRCHRNRHRRRVRGLISRISAACHQLYSPLIARANTSRIVTALSHTGAANSMATSPPCSIAPVKSGHFTCYKLRSNHELLTADVEGLDRAF